MIDSSGDAERAGFMTGLGNWISFWIQTYASSGSYADHLSRHFRNAGSPGFLCDEIAAEVSDGRLQAIPSSEHLVLGITNESVSPLLRMADGRLS